MAALLVALGLATGGYFVGHGISERSAGRRIISVKGLSEREVPASVATWTIGYSANGNDLGEINKKLADSTKAVTAFLKEAGFAEADLAVQPPSLEDTTMEVREKDVPPPPERYKAYQSVLLRTSKVDLIKPALALASNLMVSGVLLSGKSEPTYIFNQVNEIKPAMIQEATKNARIAAEQFSRDSQTTLGKLRNATQGWFQIENRDAATPERKVVRVVVDVEYEIN
ncbi:MAG: SIMPL domain-containing protein [Verrucomicrobia bacterium]|nr:MAG: SIMPL domain-containing protein [Verrucomicrobiota bacterium]